MASYNSNASITPLYFSSSGSAERLPLFQKDKKLNWFKFSFSKLSFSNLKKINTAYISKGSIRPPPSLFFAK
jgi:hypothetical protein